MASFAGGNVVLFYLFRNMWLGAPHVPEKKRYLPPCRRRIGTFIQMNT
jgi:hypothetical protein